MTYCGNSSTAHVALYTQAVVGGSTYTLTTGYARIHHCSHSDAYKAVFIIYMLSKIKRSKER